MSELSPQKALQQLGLSDKETVIYLTILQQGKVTPADIASMTGINRTTVYAIGKDLIKKGFIQEDIGKRTYFMIRPLQDLNTLVEEERSKLNRKEHMVEQLISSLTPLRGGDRYDVPRLTFIEEDEISSYMHRQSERWTKSILETDGIWHGFQDHSFVENYEEWIDWYWHQDWKDKLMLRLFTNDTETEKRMDTKKYAHRQMRFWGDNEIASTLWINGEHVVVIVTRTRPHYLFEIHDKFLSANLRETFTKLWNSENSK